LILPTFLLGVAATSTPQAIRFVVAPTMAGRQIDIKQHLAWLLSLLLRERAIFRGAVGEPDVAPDGDIRDGSRECRRLS
jgi:hypothetical protein